MSPFPDFEQLELTFLGRSYPVFRKGRGPAVVVMHEVPGLHPGVADFARRVVDAGFTVFMPSLFGTPGRPLTLPYNLQSMARACVAHEFTMFATRKTSPLTEWVRALARHAHAECGGRGVGAVGMCITGGFALAMMVDELVMAPVLSQPSLPVALTRAQKCDLGVDDETLDRVKQRARAGTPVMGLRFTCDRLVPEERFARLRQELGDAFIAVEIDSSRGNPHGISCIAHSVLAHDYVDEVGHPTRDALERVLEFFRERLGVPAA